MFCKKGFLQTLQNSQENTCARVLFLMKLRIHRFCNFIKKKRFRHKWFSVNSAKFLIASFLKNPFDGCFYINTFHLFKRHTISGALFSRLNLKTGNKSGSIFQTLSLKPIFNPVKHLRWSFFCENGLFNPLTPGVH